MYYNVRVKTYPDGHKQYMWFSEKKFRLDEEKDPPEFVASIKAKRKRSALRRAIRSFDSVADVDDPLPVPVRRRDNMSHSINEVYDIARSNEFNWFITLTLSSEYVNRYDYDSCANVIKKFTDRLRKYGCKWLIVPEQHKDGAYHFHGLVQGELPLTPTGKKSYNEKTGETLEIFNLANYEFGFTEVTKVAHPAQTAVYITKYLTKQIAVPKGRKCFWASKSLARPTVEYWSTFDDVFYFDEFTGEQRFVREHDPDWSFGIPDGVRYVKEIVNEYGRFIISEE